MGTFDIPNMRINGFDYHMSLMAGEEEWDSAEVKQVFDTWRGLLPYHQSDPLGRTLAGGGDLAEQGRDRDVPPRHLRRRRHPRRRGRPRLLHLPRAGLLHRRDRARRSHRRVLPRRGASNEAGAKEMLKFLGTPEAADAANKGTTPFIAANANADTSGYSALQTKSAEVVGAAENIAQFLDRDTRSDFASTVMIPSLQKFLENPTTSTASPPASRSRRCPSSAAEPRTSAPSTSGGTRLSTPTPTPSRNATLANAPQRERRLPPRDRLVVILMVLVLTLLVVGLVWCPRSSLIILSFGGWNGSATSTRSSGSGSRTTTTSPRSTRPSGRRSATT